MKNGSSAPIFSPSTWSISLFRWNLAIYENMSYSTKTEVGGGKWFRSLDPEKKNLKNSGKLGVENPHILSSLSRFTVLPFMVRLQSTYIFHNQALFFWNLSKMTVTPDSYQSRLEWDVASKNIKRRGRTFLFIWEQRDLMVKLIWMNFCED